MDRYSVRFVALLFISIGLSIHVTSSSRGQAENSNRQESFESAYAIYQSAIAAGDHAAALPAARQAYELGLERFGRINPNTAALAVNYGNLVANAGADTALAAQLFREADAIYRELPDPDSLNRVAALMALATVQATYEESVESVDAALRIQRAVLPEDDIAYAGQQVYGAEILGRARAERLKLGNY